MVDELSKLLSSFKDPSGFVFKEKGQLYRQINKSYRNDYDFFVSSGLFKELIKRGLIVDHKEIRNAKTPAYKIIQPEIVPFISYPFEWSFSQLKDAASATLSIQKIAIQHGMSLKDASAYNIQFLHGKPVLIDTLSFEKYPERQPWVAYRQFCQHFLAPLALMSRIDLRLGKLTEYYLDGIPLDLASRILPTKTHFNLGLGMHLHLHARSQRINANNRKAHTYNLSQKRLLAILENLISTINSLKLPKQKTVWQNYYDKTNYTNAAAKHKEKIVTAWIKQIKPRSLWDAGANDGYFSRISSKQKIFTVATDFDPMAVEKAYLKSLAINDKFLLPLLLDLTNPSPGIGWANQERLPFLERSQFDLTLALALIHHLSFSHNLPFSYIAKLFSEHSQQLIIEFVPKEDSNAQRLLTGRKNIFSNYEVKNFEKEFSKFFIIKEKLPIKESLRTLYQLKRKTE